jgi:hypothetical protein
MEAIKKLFVVDDDGAFSILRGRTKRHRVVLRLEELREIFISECFYIKHS